MANIALTVQPRESQKKKVKQLRREGVLPANLYGYGIDESVPVQMDAVAFGKLLGETGETDLIDLKVEGDEEVHPVLIYDLQYEPVSGDIMHADFYQVNLEEEVEVNVPLEFINESPAVKDRIGVLLTVIDELAVQVLPTNIPHSIEVDLSVLEEIGDQIILGDLSIPEGAIIPDLEDDEVIVKIAEMREFELEEEEDELELGEDLEEALEEGMEEDGESEEEIEEE